MTAMEGWWSRRAADVSVGLRIATQHTPRGKRITPRGNRPDDCTFQKQKRRKEVTLPRILVVSDDRYVLRLLSRIVADSCELTLASDCHEALARMAQPFELVLTHLQMRDSLDLLHAAKARWADTEVIVSIDEEMRDAAEAAYALGAYECLARFDPESVMHAIERAVERSRLRAEVARLRSELGQDRGPPT